MRIYVLDGGGPKDSENTLNSFLTKNKEKVFWQIGADMKRVWKTNQSKCQSFDCCITTRESRSEFDHRTGTKDFRTGFYKGTFRAQTGTIVHSRNFLVLFRP